jgi:hypothetical protein
MADVPRITLCGITSSDYHCCSHQKNFFVGILPREPKHCWVGIFRACFLHFPPLHSAKRNFSGITRAATAKYHKSPPIEI